MNKKILLAFLFAFTASAENKIGMILPLTGGLADYGVAIKNGIEMAQSDHPEELAHCKFLYEDSRYDPKTAVAALKKLKENDSVSMVYNFGSPTSAAIAPIASKDKIPTLLLTTDPLAVIGENFVIRAINDADEFTKSLTAYLSSKNLKKLGVVLTDNQYLNSLLEGAKHTLVPGQTLTLINTFQPTDIDFRSTIAKLSNDSYDAIGVFLLPGQVSQFYRQLKQQKLTLPTFGTDFFESSTEIKSAEGGMESAVYANNTVSKVFAERYRSQYQNDLELTFAGNGYDFGMLACATVKSASTPDAIMQKLMGVKNQSGILGDFSFVQTVSGDKYFKFPVALKQIEGLGFKEIQ